METKARSSTLSLLLRGTAGALLAAAALSAAPQAVEAAGEAVHIERQKWPFSGPFGQFDRAQLQRGFQVYQEKCIACHELKRLSFRNLAEPGGPEFPEASVKGLAATWPNKVTDGPNDDGKMFQRGGLLSDRIPPIYPNEPFARSIHNGALPPDLTLITKARGIETHAPWYTHPFLMLRDVINGYQEGGADYLYALLTGYGNPPGNMKLADGMHYNKAFPGHQIAMVAPLAKDNFVRYQDGSGSLEQNARDIAAFLSWAGDPKHDARKRMGWLVMLYLLITSVLLYFGKKRLWASAH
jgi:cytochrome c1